MAAENIQFTKAEIKVLIFIFKHFRGRYNARQIAKALSLNHAHVNKLSNILVDKKLLIRKEVGNSIIYSFDYSSELSLKFMEYILSLEEMPKWLVVLKHELEKFKKHIKFGCVFGSSIKTDKFNDIDVLLIYDRKKQSDVKRIKDSIRRAQLVDKPVRYVEITEKDILKNQGDEVFYNMLSDNIIFHNPQKYIEVLKCLK